MKSIFWVPAATLLVVGAALVGHWWTHPTVFQDRGDGFRAAPRPLARSSLTVGVTDPSPSRGAHPLTFSDARVHFVDNSARAHAQLALCRPSSGDEGGIIAVRSSDLRRICTRLRPILEGTEMAHSPASKREYVVLILRPTRPGRVQVDRIELTYALGWSGLLRRGTDSVAVDFTMGAR